jgi:DNA helicase IV
LTLWGSRSDADLDFVNGNLIFERISVTYRQSRKLAEFAAMLPGSGDQAGATTMPEHSENIGFDPVAGFELDGIPDQARWLASRMREIVDASNGAMPTIAVLMPHEIGLDEMADALSEELRSVSIKACSYRNGVARGLDQDVRVFSVEHIKGLEFEAVFFVGVDQLAERESDLFGRYLYVGATRAATYLGLTASGGTLPAALEPVLQLIGQRW